ncbi:hypothetical protein OG357_37310 [Streptomyces sp. NBC_01255]|uniref:hypothetical protein n=1 Tax=Streptomyces sp. NBC_01255 TaxID=2903798 RepID=UPI002E371AE7|nr:hypothetical protein [Streptomyces sp. NBC_01255]
MSGHFTDRDERMWQQRAEERKARPLTIGAWLRGLRRNARTSVPGGSGTEVRADGGRRAERSDDGRGARTGPLD